MNNKKVRFSIYEEVFGDVALDTRNEQEHNFKIIDESINFTGKFSVSDTLVGMHDHGPLHDGDVVSKAERDRLLSGGYCAKVVVKGLEGFNACTYRGRKLHDCIKARNELNPNYRG